MVLSTKTTHSYNSSVNSKICPNLEQFIFHSIFIHIIKTIMQNNRTPAMHQAALTWEILTEKSIYLSTIIFNPSFHLLLYLTGEENHKEKTEEDKVAIPPPASRLGRAGQNLLTKPRLGHIALHMTATRTIEHMCGYTHTSPNYIEGIWVVNN